MSPPSACSGVKHPVTSLHVDRTAVVLGIDGRSDRPSADCLLDQDINLPLPPGAIARYPGIVLDLGIKVVVPELEALEYRAFVLTPVRDDVHFAASRFVG